MQQHNKISLLEQRNFGELFDTTMAFIKQNFKLYVRTVLTYAFPIMILAGFGFAYFMQSFNILNIEQDPDIFENADNIMFSTGLLMVSGLVYMLAFILIITMGSTYVHTYVNSNDGINSLTTPVIWQKTKANIGWMLGYSFGFIFILTAMYLLAIALNVGAGFLTGYLLIITIPFTIWAFFYCMITFMYAVPLKLEEPELGFIETIKKCFELIKDKWWKSFGFLLAFNMLISVVSYIFIIPMYGFMGLSFLFGDSTLLKFISGIGISVFYSFALLASSFIYIAISVLFYSVYEEKYGLNLNEQIESIGSGTGFDSIDSI